MWTLVGNENTSITVPPTSFFAVLSASTVGFIALQYLLDPICSRLFKTYRSLNRGEKNEWNNKIFSNIHAIMLFLWGVFLLKTRDEYNNFDVYYCDESTLMMNAFSLAYFLVDTFLVIKHFPALGGTSMLFHHGFITCAALSVGLWHHLAIFSVTASMTEFTTFFINQRWFLDKTGQRTSLLYTLNGLMIWAGWLVCRIGFSVYLVALFYHKWDVILSMPLLLGGQFVVQSLNLSYLNIYWFIKITKGVMKVLFEPKNKSKTH